MSEYKDLFAEIDNFGHSEDTGLDHLEEYLNTPTHACDDPIVFWSGLLNKGCNMLACMALDVLFTPGKVICLF